MSGITSVINTLMASGAGWTKVMGRAGRCGLWMLHQVQVPPGVLPTRCASHQVCFPPGALPTRCPSYQVSFPPGVLLTRCTLDHLGRPGGLLATVCLGGSARVSGPPAGPPSRPSDICVCLALDCKALANRHHKQETPLESKCSLGCCEESSGRRALEKPSY